MSVTSRSPLRMAGASLFSGGVATGELLLVRGGETAASVFSGMVSGAVPSVVGGAISSVALAGGADVLVWSGAGRLNSVLPHTQMASGAPAVFYDSALPTSGGPFAASGHRIVGFLPTTWTAGQLGSGAVNTGSPWNGEPTHPDMPFQSGLCVHLASGTPGFTISFSVEVNPAIG